MGPNTHKVRFIASPFYDEFFGKEWQAFRPIVDFYPESALLDDRWIGDPPKQNNRLNYSFNPIEPRFSHNLDFKEWEKYVKKAQESPLHKIVIARKTLANISEGFQPIHALKQLLSKKGNLFAIAPDSKNIFFGLTPEHLFYRTCNRIYTEALAGTTSRSCNEDEDEKLENELLHSKKDLYEFSFVENFIEDQLKKLCLSVSTSDLKIKKTPNVQHLHKNFSGVLLKEISDQEIISKLHPTPAMCGYPKKEAREWLKDNEAFDRGLYASPIGFSTDAFCEVIVGIRSALVTNNHLSLYAGLGIVNQSDAKNEWIELNNKLKLMQGALLNEQRKE